LVLSVKALENTSFIIGEIMFSELLGPVMDVYLNHYHFSHWQPSVLPGQKTKDKFTIDMRNTADPVIASGIMEMSFVGELLYNGEDCKNFEPEEIEFEAGNLTQLVISESALECFAQQVSKSDIGTVYLDTESLQALFSDKSLVLTSTSKIG
jgi:hypothetical protein